MFRSCCCGANAVLNSHRILSSIPHSSRRTLHCTCTHRERGRVAILTLKHVQVKSLAIDEAFGEIAERKVPLLLYDKISLKSSAPSWSPSPPPPQPSSSSSFSFASSLLFPKPFEIKARPFLNSLNLHLKPLQRAFLSSSSSPFLFHFNLKTHIYFLSKSI